MNPFFQFFYEIILTVGAICILPKGLYDFFVHKKYRNSLSQRFGFSLPSISPDAAPSIWIHAVSVGETKAVAPLARLIKTRFPDRPLVISSTTETGHAEAKRSFPFADHHVFMPFDFYGSVSRAINKLQPGVVLYSETDLWPNFLTYAKKNGASCGVVNGKISERSVKNFGTFRSLSKRLFAMPDIFCVQNELYRSRFIEAGVPVDKILITGNLKWDEPFNEISPEEIHPLKEKMGIGPADLVLTIGSSHDTEESDLLSVLDNVWKSFPRLRVLLVPRHPERFNYVASLLEKQKISSVNFSEIERRTGDERVILIDCMGILKTCYALCDIAIVAGSFVDHIGGHNVMEPSGYGKPVIFGPHMFGQEEMARLMIQSCAGMQVNADQLEGVLKEWLSNEPLRREIGLRGFDLMNHLRGSTNRTLIGIMSLFSGLKKTS